MPARMQETPQISIIRENTEPAFFLVWDLDITINCLIFYTPIKSQAMPPIEQGHVHVQERSKSITAIKKIKERNKNFDSVVNDREELYGLVKMHDIGESLLGRL